MQVTSSKYMFGLKDSAMANRCTGTTRSGTTCSISSTSNITTDGGRLAAEPLRSGLDRCLFHCVPFETQPAHPDPETRCVLVLMDLETVPYLALDSLLGVLD